MLRIVPRIPICPPFTKLRLLVTFCFIYYLLTLKNYRAFVSYNAVFRFTLGRNNRRDVTVGLP